MNTISTYKQDEQYRQDSITIALTPFWRFKKNGPQFLETNSSSYILGWFKNRYYTEPELELELIQPIWYRNQYCGLKGKKGACVLGMFV